MALLIIGTGWALAQDSGSMTQPLDYIKKNLKYGEAIELEANGKKQFAIYTPPFSRVVQGGAILLPDRNTHPDWPQVIAPLRRQLPRFGWATLSIGLPPFEPAAGETARETFFAAATDTINAAIRYLQGRNVKTIVLIGYGTGAVAAAKFLSENSSVEISGFAAVAMPGIADPKSPLNTSTDLQKIPVPVLDLFGTNDNDSVTQSAEKRALAARQAGRAAETARTPKTFLRTESLQADTPPGAARTGSYRQVAVTGADHGFTGLSDVLVKRVRGWLHRISSRPDLPKTESAS